MPKYVVQHELFTRFPDYRRGVIRASGVDNRASAAANNFLQGAVEKFQATEPELRRKRIQAWNDAFLHLGIDPVSYSPSIAFLSTQIERGRPPRSINPLVDLMNAASLEWTIPCGGDDRLTFTGEDVSLRPALGNEVFAPLFHPSKVSRPELGEVIYCAEQSNRVFCRRWTWRNADFSKLTHETTDVLINIDVLNVFGDPIDPEEVLAELSERIQVCVGGTCDAYVISAELPMFDF